MISRIILQNFKRYKRVDFTCNSEVNIFVGENGAGKSTLLYAVGLVLSGSHSQIERSSLASIINQEAILDFMGTKDINQLPEVFVEIYFDELCTEISSNFNIEGKHNSQKIKAFGLSLKIIPNQDYISEITSVLNDSNWTVFPFEFYRVEFLTFSGKPYSSYNKPYKFLHSIINTSLIDTQQEIQKRIHEVYLENISAENRAKVNHQYRINSFKFLETLRKDELMKENASEFQLHFDESENSFRNSVSAVKNGVDIKNLGQGEKVLLGVENVYSHLKETVKILLIEEPENHLSFQNLQKLVNMFNSNTGVQVFIGTHSNMIASRLGVDNLHFLDNGQISKLERLNRDTIRFFQKSTNQNLLNFSLGKKVMLVEGNAEYILMEKFFEMIHSKRPEDLNVSIISVDGLSFERYLEIAACFIDKKVVVITDNDSDYAGKVQSKYSSYQQFQNIKVSSDLDNDNRTFEICIYNNNKDLLDSFGLTKSKDLLGYMLREKTEFALRLLEKMETDYRSDEFIIPDYIEEAIEWIIKD
ncbi:ATP-dependent nuclease [Streptococcus pseudopneumoniae]|uniref:Putative ATP-dependentend nuclease of the OLD family n=1 Tax=Streptococcus pseudopneumoniae TaxID=257758 RepID=A0A0T8UDQ8_9STRE|nr:AAA family ATPase [Streptococcus pseudopneumoniae]CKB14885.1 putative ATP-dependentend nuclease of the OLD family [Streptococcus pseudopneumoniae]